MEWEGDRRMHAVRVLGAEVKIETYGDDADGRRGVEYETAEWTDIEIEPPLDDLERIQWEAYSRDQLQDDVIAAVVDAVGMGYEEPE